MARAETSSTRPLIATTTVLLVLAFLPTRLLVPWTNDIAAIVQLPLAPLGDFGGRFANRLRPGPDPSAGATATERRLVEERDALRALLRSEQLLVVELREQIEALSLAAALQGSGTFDLVHATVTGRSPGRRDGPWRLNVGSRNGVRAGSVAVYRGGHLIGRVAEDVGRLSCLLVPLTDHSIGRLRGAVLLEGGTEGGAAPVRVLLTPVGDGTFHADGAADSGIMVGHAVVLDDPAWSPAGRGMVIGFVESIVARDDQPLRRRLVIRPAHDAQHVASVVVKFERPARPTRPSSPGAPTS